MCAGGQYWAGIGRLVFAVSGEQLGALVADDTNSLHLSSREVFARGGRPIEVDGPCDELAAEAVAVFDGYWSRELTVGPSVVDRSSSASA